VPKQYRYDKTNIMLTGGVNRQIENYVLDLYAISRYKKEYSKVKTLVNKDIRDICSEYDTVEVKFIREILILKSNDKWGEMLMEKYLIS